MELVLGPRIRAEEFELKLHVKGIGNVVVKNVEFKGELEVGAVHLFISQINTF